MCNYQAVDKLQAMKYNIPINLTLSNNSAILFLLLTKLGQNEAFTRIVNHALYVASKAHTNGLGELILNLTMCAEGKALDKAGEMSSKEWEMWTKAIEEGNLENLHIELARVYAEEVEA